MGKVRCALVFILLALPVLLYSQEWRYAGRGGRTVWSQKIKNPDRVEWDYPRPHMLRNEWMHLNGIWNYVVTSSSTDTMPSTERKIFVPFSFESPLSGVGRTILERDALWYGRSFTIPGEWSDREILLHFGGVEKDCQVYVNGQLAGSHSGKGEFSFRISRFLEKKGPQRLVVKVRDGKFEGDRSVSGIWQTVWLEPVSRKAFVDSCSVVSDVSSGTLSISPHCTGIRSGDKIQIYVFDDDMIVGNAVISPGGTAVVKLQSPKLWAPLSGRMYDYSVNILRGGKLLDVVRCCTVFKGNAEIPARHLDAKAKWWIDGHCTPPCEEALARELSDIVKEASSYGCAVYRSAYPTDRLRYLCQLLGIILIEE